MDVSQARRFELYDKMRQTIGNDHAATLMEILPPMDANDIATKRDVENATVVMRGEMAELRTDLRGEMVELRSELRGEMAELRTDLRGEMTELRSELRTEMTELRTDLRTEMADLRVDLTGMTHSELGAMRADLSTALGMINAQFGELRGEFAELRGEFKASTRHTIVTVVAAATTVWLTAVVPTLF